MSKWFMWLVVLVACGAVETVAEDSSPPTTMRQDPTTSVVSEIQQTLETTTTTSTVVVEFDATAWVTDQRNRWGKCGELHDLAMSVGWQEEHWSTLSTVLWTESRCRNLIPVRAGGSPSDAKWFNGHDWGPTQINKPVHKEFVEQIFGEPFEVAMADPAKNLRFAYILYSSREAEGKCGWKPWSEPCS